MCCDSIFSGDTFQDIFVYDTKEGAKEKDTQCTFLVYIYVAIQETYGTVLTSLINMVATSDISILQEGYLSVRNEKQAMLEEWLKSIFENKNMVCAMFILDASLWKDQDAQDHVLLYMKNISPSIYATLNNFDCQSPSEKISITFKNGVGERTNSLQMY